MHLSLADRVAANLGVLSYWLFALAVMASVAWQMAAKYGWVDGPHARAVAGGIYKSMRVSRGWRLDLDDGGKPDLRWTSAARRGPGPRVVRPERGATIALAGDLPWEKINRDTLAGLKYSGKSLTEGADGQIRHGTVFAVRTAEGNLAKVRMVFMGGTGTKSEWEWVVYEQPANSR